MARVHLNPIAVNWTNQDHCLFLNPRWPQKDFSILTQTAEKALSRIDSHTGFLVLASSGTSQAVGQNRVQLKIISKENFLSAARSFNSFFSITAKDIFLRALPTFHVGGLALLARAFLAGAQVIDFQNEKWQALEFVEQVKKQKITRISLVPTQIFDLVQRGLPAPSSVDTVFVGGAALADRLRQQAVEQGWPLLASYGMTETSSMVASQIYADRWRSEVPSKFYPLPGVELRTDSEHRVFLKTSGLLSYELSVNLDSSSFSENQIKEFKRGEEFRTQDFGFWDGKSFAYLGRAQDLIKISGELVSLAQLRSVWESLSGGISEQTCLLDMPHSRSENEVILVSRDAKNTPALQSLIEQYNEKVLPFEKIKRWVTVERIPRSELGKVLVNELRAEVLKKEFQ